MRHCLATRSVDFAELLVGWFSSTREEAMFPANSTTPDAAPQIGEQASAQQTNPQIVSNNGVVGTIATSSKSFPSLTTCEKCCTIPERALGPASQVKVCDNKHPSTHQNTSRPCVRSGNCPQMASSLETLVLFCLPGKSPFHVLPTGWVWMNRHENETKYDFQTQVLIKRTRNIVLPREKRRRHTSIPWSNRTSKRKRKRKRTWMRNWCVFDKDPHPRCGSNATSSSVPKESLATPLSSSNEMRGHKARNMASSEWKLSKYSRAASAILPK